MKNILNFLFLLIALIFITLIFGCPKNNLGTTEPIDNNTKNRKTEIIKNDEKPSIENSSSSSVDKEAYKEQEPNDHYLSPNKVSELVIIGSISDKEDKDQFELLGQQGNQPTFTLEHSDDANFDIKVYSNNEKVAGSTAMKSPDIVKADVPGTCLIMIYSLRGTGDYKLTITSGTNSAPLKAQIDENQGKSSEKEPNDFNNPTPFTGEIIYGQIENSTDEDWYLVSLPTESEKTFAIYHDPANDFDFEIHTDTGILATVMSAETGDSRKIKVPSTFKIKVWKGKGTGWYRIEIK